jgi:hypothetical protein
VVLPGTDTLPLATWKNLGRFVAQGGVVIALGTRPTNSEAEFPSIQVQGLAEEMFGGSKSEPSTQTNRKGGAGVFLPSGSEALLPLVLEGIIEPDVKIADPHAPVRATHRRIEGHEVYFLINDSDRAWDGDVDVWAAGAGAQWDPATGTQAALGQPGLHHLKLEPYGATLLRFPSARLPRRFEAKPGALPNLVLRPLPEVQPVVSRGEFVREELSREALPGASGTRPWQVKATLTKGQVDTFLFVRFAYPQSLDLSRTDCLEIETWVPSGQQTPTQLLVILQEKDGGDFLASTPRSLGASGHDRTFIPLSRFQLAGWSKDADGVLDPARVAEIRIGWGGYFGNAGERVVFSLAAPQLGSATGP